MRWSYKTVHYELQKEGLLGSAFLDESEVEKSLNDYGKAGWELVSVLETMDGLIAVFKQPLSYDKDFFVSEPREAASLGYSEEPGEPVKDDDMVLQDKHEEIAVVQQETIVEKKKVVEMHESVDELIDDEPAVDVGSIRIE